MPIDYTCDALIESVKSRGILPSSQNTFTDRDIADIFWQELKTTIVPLIMAEHEEYLVNIQDYIVDPNQNSYEIPEKSLGNKLRDISLINGDNKNILFSRLEPESLKNNYLFCWDYRLYGNSGFYFEDDHVVLYPDASNYGGYTLRMRYFKRPNQTVVASDAGQITAIDTNTKEVTLSNAPSSWTVNMIYDVIKGTPSFKCKAEGVTITNKSGFILTFSELPEDMIVGDWVAESGYSPIPQIPYDIHELLAQRSVIRILSSLGDDKGTLSAIEIYKDMVNNFRTLITPRSDGTPQKLTSRNMISCTD